MMIQKITVSRAALSEKNRLFFAPPCRADRYIILLCPDLTRNQLQSRLEFLTINQKPAKLSQLVKEGDFIEWGLKEPPALELKAEKISLDVLYEDENTLVINKPQGMVVHPGANHFSGTLVNALLGRGTLDEALLQSDLADSDLDWDEENSENSLREKDRPGIVHRLDKETSGVILTVKNLPAHSYYANLFKTHNIEKKYLAIVKGVPFIPLKKIESYLVRDRKNRIKFCRSDTKGKYAISHYRLLQENGLFSLLEVLIETGRTHQIRVHLSSEQLPILGDPLYSRADSLYPHATLMLHAFSLTFVPMGRGKPILIRAPLPVHFREQLKALNFKFED